MKSSSLVFLVTFLTCISASCGKKKKDDTASVDAKLRSTGQSLKLVNLTGGTEVQQYLEQQAAELTGSTAVSNSTVTIESYTVPISSISLAQGLSGSGYTGGSSIYSCPGSTDDSCRVDLSKTIDVDNLLSGPGKQDVAAGTFAGIAVEFCHEHSSQVEGTGKGYFDVKVKGSVTLGSTTYYTNSNSGLSTTAPSQEISIRLKGAGCGVTTALVQPITLNKGDSTTVTLYADPNGSLFATDTSALFNNVTCVGSDPASLCAQPVAVYATNDSTTPTVERYTLKFSDTAGTAYSNGLLSVLFNSTDQAIGAMAANVFTNTSSTRALSSNFNFMNVKTNSDGTLTFAAFSQDGSSTVDVISNLSRKATSTGTISQFVSSSLSWSASKN